MNAGADYVFILNNDVTVEPDCVSLLVEAAKQNPRAGLLAPKVLYHDSRHIINSLGTRMDWLRLRPVLMECGLRDDPRELKPFKREILVGCALLVPKETIERIGFLDERFFLIHEEADWCYRNLKSGYENLTVPRAAVYHKASLTLKDYPALTHYYSIRNCLYLAQKNASFLQRLAGRIGLGALAMKHCFWLKVSKDPDRQALAGAFFDGVRDFFKGKMGPASSSGHIA